jgi:hypothetical protein
MPGKPLKILAINPGTRYLGTAFFEGTELLDWRVKVIEGKWSGEKMEIAKKTVSILMDCWRPDVLAIKLLHPARSSRNLKGFVAKVKELSKRRGLKIYQYSIKELEDFFSPEEEINKRKLAEIIASQHPELLPELEKERSRKNPYHLRMFEAVALGLMCFHQLDRQNHAQEQFKNLSHRPRH